MGWRTVPRLMLVALLAASAASCAGRLPWQDSAAVSALRAKAEAGDVASQYALGLRYTNGREVGQDYVTAAGWFRRAAGQGHGAAAYMLGIANYSGRGVPRNHAEAVQWFERAAARGNPRAQYQLGDAYANGRGAKKEPAWAARWFAKAARQGHLEAQYALGVAHAAGLGVAVDATEAAKWLTVAAKNGHAEAERVLAAVTAGMAREDIVAAERLAAAWSAAGPAGYADPPTVRFVQAALGRLGHGPGPVDGVAGPGTLEAVAGYRRAAGMAPGGIEAALVARLRAELKAKARAAR